MSKLAQFLKSQVPDANAANTANPGAADANISNSSNFSSGVMANSLLPEDLDRRIRAMASRWGFSADELAAELAGATADPFRALLWVEIDESKYGTGETLNARH